MRAAVVLTVVAGLGGAALAAVATGGGTPSPNARAAACTAKRLPPASLAGEIVLYGHARSLRRSGGVFRLRFDPAFWLGGETANRAAAEDGVILPGEPVPNDYYVRDESHKLLTFRLPAAARAGVLVHGARGICATNVGVAELAQLIAGRNPRRRRLYVPGNRLGFWLRARADTMRSLDQQYQP